MDDKTKTVMIERESVKNTLLKRPKTFWITRLKLYYISLNERKGKCQKGFSKKSKNFLDDKTETVMVERESVKKAILKRPKTFWITWLKLYYISLVKREKGKMSKRHMAETVMIGSATTKVTM